MNETPIRSFIKAISWRLIGTVDTFVISYIVTGQIILAGGIAMTEVITKICLFWLHERAWGKISWGRK